MFCKKRLSGTTIALFTRKIYYNPIEKCCEMVDLRLNRAILRDGDQFRRFAAEPPVTLPVLKVSQDCTGNKMPKKNVFSQATIWL